MQVWISKLPYIESRQCCATWLTYSTIRCNLSQCWLRVLNSTVSDILRGMSHEFLAIGIALLLLMIFLIKEHRWFCVLLAWYMYGWESSSERQGGGKYLMIWDAYRRNVKTDVAVLDEHQNAGKYRDTLQSNLVTFLAHNYSSSRIIQQKYASLHTTRLITAWFREKHILVMKWPTKNPDLKTFENDWRVSAHWVYENTRSFSNLQKLRAQDVQEWTKIGLDFLNVLNYSMWKWCADVLYRQDARIDY